MSKRRGPAQTLPTLKTTPASATAAAAAATHDDEAVEHWLTARTTLSPFHFPRSEQPSSPKTPLRVASQPMAFPQHGTQHADGAAAQQGADGAAAAAACQPGKFAFLLSDRLLADTNLVLKRLQSKAGDHFFHPHAALLAPPNNQATEPTHHHPVQEDRPGSPLLFSGGPGAVSTGGDEADESVLEAFTVHSTVMCANSPYFRAKLLSPGSQPASPSVPAGPDGATGPFLKVLEELLMPADVPAMKSVLRFMYTEVLDYRHGVHSPASLVTILRIADRFKVTDCVAACRREFSKLRVSDIDLEVLRMVFSIDTIVNDTTSFTEMMSAVQERLLGMFKDVVAVVRSPALLSQFLTLPFAAVAALLRSDRLVTDSENSVVVLASLWMSRSPAAQYCTAEQKKYIAGCVRLGLLTPSYLCGVLPNLRWFSYPRDMAGPYFQAIQARLTASGESRTLLQAQGQKPSPPSPCGMSQPRAQTKDLNLELNLEIEEKSLAEYLKAGHEQLRSADSSSSDVQAFPLASSGPDGGVGGGGCRGVQVNSETMFFSGYLFGIKLVFGHTSTAGASTAAATGSGSGSGPAGGSGSVTAAAAGTGPGNTAAAATATATAGGGSGAGRGLFGMSSSKRGSAGGTAAAAAAAAATAAAQAAAGGSASSDEARLAVTPSVFASIPPGEEALLPLSSPINVCFRCSLEALGPYGTPFAAATFTGGSFVKPGDEAESSVAVSNFFRKVGSSLHEISAWRPFMSDGKLKLKLTLQGATLE